MMVLYTGLLMFALGGVYLIKSLMVKSKEKKFRKLQLMTFVDKGYVDVENEEGQDLLYLAATGEYPDVTEKIVKKGGDPNRIYDGKTLLHILALDHPFAVEVAKVLLKNGANPDGDPSCETTPLGQCCLEDNTSLANVLIKKGADVNRQTLTTRMTPLMTAVYYHSIFVGRALIEAGADPFLKTRDGRTALDYAYTKPDAPMGGSGDSASTHQNHDRHNYNELIRQIKCLMEGKKYKYKKPKKGSSHSSQE